MVSSARARVDACPGVFATHPAADGALARVRLPGGAVTAAQLRVLADAADELGDGHVHLTSRANLQLRGVRGERELVTRLAGAGLLPAPGHERVRNYLASPASGLFGGLLDVRDLLRRLDEAVCARPGLATLPGRFLFALDDGRGDVAAEGPDVCWHATGPGEGALLAGGTDTGLRVPVSGAVPALVAAAEAFQELRGEGEHAAWRVRELPGGGRALAATLTGRPDEAVLPPTPAVLAPGLHRQDDGGYTACAAPVFGVLPSATVRLLAGLVPAAVVTPWRSVLLPDYPERGLGALAGAGLTVSAADPAYGVSACTGRPGCAKARADVRADTRRVLPLLPAGVRAHVSGCERRCGRPKGGHIDVVATEGGYRVDGEWTPAACMADGIGKGKV